MQVVHLIHNPGAGSNKYSDRELIQLIESAGFRCRYYSTKDGDWKHVEPGADFIAVAGGDGAIRKVVKFVLKNPESALPLAILPLGTANNIAGTLGLIKEIEELVSSWKTSVIKAVDVGMIEGIKESFFMIESFGYGIFPYLMLEMQKVEARNELSPRRNLVTAWQLMHNIVNRYEPHNCKLTIDGSDHSGKFIMAEVMNICSIGPRLMLSPNGDPGDGEFEVILIPEEQREKFIAYVKSKLEGRESAYSYHTLKGKQVKISWQGTHVHVDDKIVKLKSNNKVSISLHKGLVRFMIPGSLPA